MATESVARKIKLNTRKRLYQKHRRQLREEKAEKKIAAAIDRRHRRTARPVHQMLDGTTESDLVEVDGSQHYPVSKRTVWTTG